MTSVGPRFSQSRLRVWYYLHDLPSRRRTSHGVLADSAARRTTGGLSGSRCLSTLTGQGRSDELRCGFGPTGYNAVCAAATERRRRAVVPTASRRLLAGGPRRPRGERRPAGRPARACRAAAEQAVRNCADDDYTRSVCFVLFLSLRAGEPTRTVSIEALNDASS